jgi:hypothetical protein
VGGVLFLVLVGSFLLLSRSHSLCLSELEANMPRPILRVLNTGTVHSSDSPHPALNNQRLGNVLLILITGLCVFAVMASAPSDGGTTLWPCWIIQLSLRNEP